MIGIRDATGRINFHLIVWRADVLEEAVHWVQYLLRDHVEPFTRHATIVKAFFAFELFKKTSLLIRSLC